MGIINSFMSELINPSNDQQRIFSLLVIGEVGRHMYVYLLLSLLLLHFFIILNIDYRDLSSVVNLKETILQSFSSNSEEIKSSASYSLGSISIGNLEQYIPFILREIDMQPKRQYLLLHSLKEVISTLKYNFYFLIIIKNNNFRSSHLSRLLLVALKI